jgi:hypothetical protein
MTAKQVCQDGERPMSEAVELARWFVEHVLGERFDFALHRRFLGEAKSVLDAGFSSLDVREALRLALDEGVKPRSLWAFRLVSKTHGRPYIDLALEVPEPPGVDQQVAYDAWFRTYGPRAARLRPDLAVYRGWDGRFSTPEAGPLTFRELVSLVGADLALEALARYRAWLARRSRVFGRGAAP